MSQPSDPAVPEDVFDEMVHRGHANLTLAFATRGGDVEEFDEQETMLIDTGVTAGVVGALEWLRERGIDVETL